MDAALLLIGPEAVDEELSKLNVDDLSIGLYS